MNPIRIFQNAYAALAERVSVTVDRRIDQDRERHQRRERYEAEIARGREQLDRQRGE